MGRVATCAGRPFLAGLRGDLIEPQVPKFRPGLLKFAEAPEAIFFTRLLKRSVMFKLRLEPFHRFTEFRRGNLVPVFPMFLEEIIQFQLPGRADRGLQALPDHFSVNFNFPKVIPADNVLQQVRDFRKRAHFPFVERCASRFRGSVSWLSCIGCTIKIHGVQWKNQEQ
jgi:hypothetical protein